MVTTQVSNTLVKSKKASSGKFDLKNPLTSYGTGRRKNAVARVWVKVGTGKVLVNGKSLEDYFVREVHRSMVLRPFTETKVQGQYDIMATVKGGGSTGQVGALIHGVARALDKLAPDFHQILRKNGFLTRDSRVVERKKYGRLKARKKTPFKRR